MQRTMLVVLFLSESCSMQTNSYYNAEDSVWALIQQASSPSSDANSRQICSRRSIPWWTKEIRAQETNLQIPHEVVPRTPFQSVTSEVINSKIKSTRLQSSCQQNMYHYFFYNRLMDYWHNMDIVNEQYRKMAAQAKSGETVVRDCLHRFMYKRN